MNISHAFIQKQGRELQLEEKIVANELEARGVPITYFTRKNIQRRNLGLNETTLVVGEVNCVYGAIKQLNKVVPIANCYPDILGPYLNRNVEKSTVDKLRRRFQEGFDVVPVFAKPFGKHKQFIGRVFHSQADLYVVNHLSKHTEIWLASPINFISEFRIYVIDGEILSVSYIDGDITKEVDRNVVEQAISTYERTLDKYRGYAIDFGCTDDGKTALIELNEGFSIGAYEPIKPHHYCDLLITRWHQLMSQPAP